jgi:hypothetical protein
MAPLLPSAAGEGMTSAPKISSSWRRSTDTFSGRTTRSLYPFTRQTRAKPIPVLPELGSRMVSPGRSRPASSASSIIDLAMRSFTEPPGFIPSSFTKRRTAGFGESSCAATNGVLPIRSRTESTRMGGLTA